MTLNKYYLENKGTCSDVSITEWQMINWPSVSRRLQKLQRRITKAVHEQRWHLARDLRRCLTRSFSAKLLAVKKVTSNRGKRTPGVDGVIWSTPNTKLPAAYSLLSKGYKASPLRRVLIPKSNGKIRPLSIPTLYDKAMQALYASALLPEAETIAAPNSYGFRPKRAAADAKDRCSGNGLSQDLLITSNSFRQPKAFRREGSFHPSYRIGSWMIWRKRFMTISRRQA